MATTAVCGHTGSVSIGGGAGEVVSWTLDFNEDIPEATSMASAGFKEYIACLKDANGTFITLKPMGTIGAHAAATFINDNETFTLNVIVTDIAVGMPVDGRREITYTFVSTGAVVIS